jgi:hypothetical protein
MKNLLKEILGLLSQEKWIAAAELIKSNGVSDDLDLALAAIYAGIESDDENLVDQGIAVAIKLLKNSSKIDPLSDTHYDLGNAYHYYRQEFCATFNINSTKMPLPWHCPVY